MFAVKPCTIDDLTPKQVLTLNQLQVVVGLIGHEGDIFNPPNPRTIFPVGSALYIGTHVGYYA